MSVSALSAIEPIALIFKLNNKMVERSVEGVTDDEFWRSLAGGNPIGWLLGHVTHTRAQILTMMGHTYDSGLGPLFKRGTPLHDPADYPARAAIEAAWGDSRGHMRDAFASLTA